MTRAPHILANCSANSETPPVPWVSTVCPGLMSPSLTTALQAVRPAQGSAAASMSLRWSGVRTSACAGNTRYSVSTPSTLPPSARASAPRSARRRASFRRSCRSRDRRARNP